MKNLATLLIVSIFLFCVESLVSPSPLNEVSAPFLISKPDDKNFNEQCPVSSNPFQLLQENTLNDDCQSSQLVKKDGAVATTFGFEVLFGVFCMSVLFLSIMALSVFLKNPAIITRFIGIFLVTYVWAWCSMMIYDTLTGRSIKYGWLDVVKHAAIIFGGGSSLIYSADLIFRHLFEYILKTKDSILKPLLTIPLITSYIVLLFYMSFVTPKKMAKSTETSGPPPSQIISRALIFNFFHTGVLFVLLLALWFTFENLGEYNGFGFGLVTCVWGLCVMMIHKILAGNATFGWLDVVKFGATLFTVGSSLILTVNFYGNYFIKLIEYVLSRLQSILSKVAKKNRKLKRRKKERVRCNK